MTVDHGPQPSRIEGAQALVDVGEKDCPKSLAGQRDCGLGLFLGRGDEHRRVDFVDIMGCVSNVELWNILIFGRQRLDRMGRDIRNE